MLLNNKHYYNLSSEERKDLWKHYKKAYPNMGYSDMVNHFHGEVEKYRLGGKEDKYVAERDATATKKTPAISTNPNAFKEKVSKYSGPSVKDLDVVTDVMQLGNFIPLPPAQLVGKIGNVAGAAIDTYQAVNDYDKGNYGDMVGNLGSAALGIALGSKGYKRDMWNTTPGSTAEKIAKLGSREGTYRPLTAYKHLKNNPVIKKGINYNKAGLGAVGAETAYDYQFGGRTDYFNSDIKKYQNGGKDNLFASLQTNIPKNRVEVEARLDYERLHPEIQAKREADAYAAQMTKNTKETSEVYQTGSKKGRPTGKGAIEESVSPIDFMFPAAALENVLIEGSIPFIKTGVKAAAKVATKTSKPIVSKTVKSASKLSNKIIKPGYNTEKLAEDMHPYISKRIAPMNKEEEIMNSFYSAEKQAANEAKRTTYYDNKGNVIPSPQQAGFINTKGAFQKYPKGPLTQEEITAYRNSPQYQQVTQEHLDAVKKYGDSWKLGNYMEDALQEAIATGNRNRINPTLYGGRNWGAADYAIAGLAATAYPGYAGIMGLAFSPPAVKNKVLNKVGITSTPGSLSSRDTTIDLTNRNMDFAKVNQTTNGQMILGGEFIEGTNNTVRKAKDWLTATDTYSDKEYSSKDIQSFYGIENGKFKVGKVSDFKSNTEIVPRRFGETNIKQAVLNEGGMRLLDNKGNPIYQNTPNTGKFILYSPSTKKSEFNYITSGKKGVDKVNKFLKENKDAQYIHLDNGRYEFYAVNPEGLTDQDFRNYYQQDLEREGNPGYNIILKKKGGLIK